MSYRSTKEDDSDSHSSSSFDSSDSEEYCNTSSEFFPSDSESDEDKDENYMFPVQEFGWRSEKREEDCTPPAFNVYPGIRVNFNSNKPLEMFELLFSESITDVIVRETNRTGNSLPNTLKSKYNWRIITRNDIMILAATLIAQQLNWTSFLNKQPRYDETRIAFIYKIITFTSDPSAKSVMAKAKPIVKLIRNRFQSVYMPRQKLMIDERMTFMSRGMISLRNCHGLASYCVSECLSGYVYNFIVRLSDPSPQTHDFEIGYKKEILYKLMGGLFGRGYHIYTMNYYNSLELALDIKQKQTGFVGCIRNKVKNIPTDLREHKLNVGEFAHRYENSGNMLLMKLNVRKRDSYLVSTIHSGEETVEVTKKGQTAVVPKLVADYEASDENVKFEDFCLESFPFEVTKVTVTYRRIFRHTLNLLVSNAHALHKINAGNLKLGKFQMLLCSALVNKYL